MSNKLNETQIKTIRETIIGSMKNAYVNSNATLDIDFDKAAGSVADDIIKKAQITLDELKIKNKKHARK